jgi:hypothetical protein
MAMWAKLSRSSRRIPAFDPDLIFEVWITSWLTNSQKCAYNGIRF